LLGREGIDRPGGTWSAVVGQQVTTVRRRDPWAVGVGCAVRPPDRHRDWAGDRLAGLGFLSTR
ncbi:MAG: hypothetical protein HC828_19815, partial [Blastochloris sp.]|nr:hypothetical protein [Blastochloris sp.]